MIDDAQALDAQDPRLGVDDSHGIPRLAHRAGRAGVPQRLGILADPLEDRGVAGDGSTRGELIAQAEGYPGRGVPDLPRALDGCDGYFGICWVGEPAEIDGWGV